ncbi:(S)-ureidoglycine aminohydrolase [Abditibacteriota bacterium]|nr:(S)-ureidoglycine aminohydrolase [Abditibacteriota bacterium]
MNPQLFSRIGQTRTVLARDHALIAPDGHVVTPLPNWVGASGVVLISPAMGARLAQSLVWIEPNSEAITYRPSAGIEACFYVLEGELQAGEQTLRAGSYVFLPAGEHIELKAKTSARLVVFEKRHTPKANTKAPRRVIGHAENIEGKPFMGDPDAVLQVLLPETPEFDMAVNVFSYQPGATLPFVETHIMEHGLLMLDGEGIYRLNESWYPVAAGDCIWMAAYCPQWFAATGKVPSRYIYYKDINRDSMEAL